MVRALRVLLWIGCGCVGVAMVCAWAGEHPAVILVTFVAGMVFGMIWCNPRVWRLYGQLRAAFQPKG